MYATYPRALLGLKVEFYGLGLGTQTVVLKVQSCQMYDIVNVLLGLRNRGLNLLNHEVIR